MYWADKLSASAEQFLSVPVNPPKGLLGVVESWTDQDLISYALRTLTALFIRASQDY